MRKERAMTKTEQKNVLRSNKYQRHYGQTKREGQKHRSKGAGAGSTLAAKAQTAPSTPTRGGGVGGRRMNLDIDMFLRLGFVT